MSWDPDLRRCPHDRIVLVESGYEREWAWIEGDPEIGPPVAQFSGLEGFSDEGDGVYRLRCKTCLKDLGEPPSLWEWD